MGASSLAGSRARKSGSASVTGRRLCIVVRNSGLLGWHRGHRPSPSTTVKVTKFAIGASTVARSSICRGSSTVA